MFSNVTDDTHYYRRWHRHERMQTRKEEEEDKPQVPREDRTAAAHKYLYEQTYLKVTLKCVTKACFMKAEAQ